MSAFLIFDRSRARSEHRCLKSVGLHEVRLRRRMCGRGYAPIAAGVFPGLCRGSGLGPRGVPSLN